MAMFRLREHSTTVWAEVRGGLVTFLTLSYILFVQPAILSGVGMPWGDVFFATCVCSAIACFLMGCLANYPFALAPAMGHNVFFAVTVCGTMGFVWPEALLANLIAGGVFLFLSLFGLREAVMHAVPEGLKYAIAVGIGLLIAFVGLQYGAVVQANSSVLVGMGNLKSPVVLVTLAGIVVVAVLAALRLRGAILVGILATAAIALAASYWARPAYPESRAVECIPLGRLAERRAAFDAGGSDPVKAVPRGEVRMILAELPEGWHMPSLPKETFGAAVTKGVRLFRDHGLLEILVVIFVFFFLDLFDTVGTLIGVSERAGFLDEKGRLPRARQALFSDAVGTVTGALVGTSTITTYVESAAGISSGARTGLAAIVTGMLLLLALVFAPLVQMIGKGVQFIGPAGEPLVQVAAGTGDPVSYYPVIAPVLVIIGVMMMSSIRKIRWEDNTEAIPAFLTIVVMQFTLSITDGIAWGFISYAILKLVTGRARVIHWLVALFAVLFVGMYVGRAMVTHG